MNICHLNTTDHEGGAYRAAFRLHTFLASMGHTSSMCVGMRRRNVPGVHAIEFWGGPVRRLRRRMRRARIQMAARVYGTCRSGKFESFHDDRSQYGAELAPVLPECDVINLHFVSGLVDYTHFFAGVTARVPVVWTLHDMNPFTGGCHFDSYCCKWVNGCGGCPQLGSANPRDLSSRVWQRKHASLSKVDRSRVSVVAPSHWLADEARRSPILGRFPVHVIPYGIDATTFKPRNCTMAREVLGLPGRKRIVLFVAQQVKNRRKGFHLLREALASLPATDDVCLVTAGIDVPACELPVQSVHLGLLASPGLMTLVYSAADVFVAPSLQDNLPNTVLESMACGTPVVAFNVGGLPDMVRPGETGLLAEHGDAASLAKCVAKLLRDDSLRMTMSASCRRRAIDDFSPAVEAERYHMLYRNLLGACYGSKMDESAADHRFPVL